MHNPPVLQGPDKTVFAYDLCSKITIPADWVVLDIHETAVLQAADLEKQQHIIVITESKYDLVQYMGMDLDAYSRLKRWYIIDSLSDVSLGKTLHCTIGGKRAIQAEIEGTGEGERTTYLHTCVEGTFFFHQIIAWTSAGKYAGSKPVFQRVIDSFVEISP